MVFNYAQVIIQAVWYSRGKKQGGRFVIQNFTWLEPDGFVPTFVSSHNLILQKVEDRVNQTLNI